MWRLRIRSRPPIPGMVQCRVTAGLRWELGDVLFPVLVSRSAELDRWSFAVKSRSVLLLAFIDPSVQCSACRCLELFKKSRVSG